METTEILTWLSEKGSDYNIAGMKRFGIESEKVFGVKLAEIETLKKQIKINHPLALELWDTGYHEARHLAAIIADSKIIKEETLEKWVLDFDNWAICDSTCGKLFQKTKYSYDKIYEWQQRDELFVKRSAFALIAWIAVHHKKLPDSFFMQYLDLILNNLNDERHYIKKAVNWALRQIGKRNFSLANECLEICNFIKDKNKGNKSAIWIASDAERDIRKKFLL